MTFKEAIQKALDMPEQFDVTAIMDAVECLCDYCIADVNGLTDEQIEARCNTCLMNGGE